MPHSPLLVNILMKVQVVVKNSCANFDKQRAEDRTVYLRCLDYTFVAEATKLVKMTWLVVARLVRC